MIPCMMIVLGAVLHKGPGSVDVPARLIVGVSAFRLIIIPLLGNACCALHAYAACHARLCRCGTGYGSACSVPMEDSAQHYVRFP